MKSVSWLRMRILFEGALALAPEERPEYLDAQCAGDEEMRSAVDRLLEQSSRSEGLLEPLGGRSLSSIFEEAPLDAGLRVPGFVIERVLARGGMGIVYEARQENPPRRVALKTLRRALASEDSVARLRREGEILGRLRHPNIAQVYDAGVIASDGEELPFFAMEYIQGARDVTDYARTSELGRDERLALFLVACDGVQHGHAKGVIHRDIKPSNLLVDPDGHLSVIDFGLARATDGDQWSVSVMETRVGQVLGTLASMSPEHVSGRPDDIDVRSDVYSLGCVLCELLTGRPPFDFTGQSVTEAARRIEAEPPKLDGELPSEVRWVLLRALAKDPSERYGSVSELAADLRRFLANEPVLAGPPTFGRRARALYRRHRGFVLACAAVVALLTVALIRERGLVEQAEAAQANSEKRMHDAYDVSAAYDSVFIAMQARELEEGGPLKLVETFEGSLEDPLVVAYSRRSPQTRAALELTLAQMLRQTERLDEAGEITRAAHATLEQNLDPLDPSLLAAELHGLDEDWRLGRHEQVLAAYAKQADRIEAAFGLHHSNTYAFRESWADILKAAGQLDAAETVARESLERYRTKPDRVALSEERLWRQLGLIMAERGIAPEVVEVADALCAWCDEAIGAEEVVTVHNVQWAMRLHRRRWLDADDREELGVACELARRVYGSILSSDQFGIEARREASKDLSALLTSAGAYDELVDVYRTYLDELAERPPYDSWDRAWLLGFALNQSGRTEEAEEHFRFLIETLAEAEEDDLPDVAVRAEIENQLAESLLLQDRLDEALTCYDAALERGLVAGLDRASNAAVLQSRYGRLRAYVRLEQQQLVAEEARDFYDDIGSADGWAGVRDWLVENYGERVTNPE